MGGIRAVEAVWSYGRVVYLVPGDYTLYHRVGLIYSPVELLPDPEHMSLVEPEVLATLPTTVLERVHGRDVGRPDEPPPFETSITTLDWSRPEGSSTEPETVVSEVQVRKSRYERDPVI
jgi:hypothetical protein